MADLTIEIMQQCQQLSHGRRDIGGYVQTHSVWSGWECTCKGYQFRRTCKHSKQAEAEQCTWHQQYGKAQTERQEKDCICPECGGPTEYVRVGV